MTFVKKRVRSTPGAMPLWGWALGMVVSLAVPSALAQKVPNDFRCELLFKVPEIEHPSVVACDDAGNLFVGEDPMDMRGPATKEFDRILLFRWDPKGGPPRRTVFCENLSAVFGMVWLDGTLYVMHAPHYTMFRDTNGDGVADLRKDLAQGFGPKAGLYGFNDHIVTGMRLGMDGYLYISVGDKGIQKATGADGSTLTLEGGGIVRMRPDGTRLEIVSSGTRNHLDVAMDSWDNLFTYDNTDDGLGWWTRLTHHIPTGYYGYPYDYLKHPERHLPRISEHGGGSPCGGACYRGAAWPERFRDSAFFAEWGKGKVQRFQLKRQGATFTAELEDFMTHDGSGEFRPVDLCFSPDGQFMYVADWNYGGWVKPDVVGRVFRVSYIGGAVAAEPARAPHDSPIATWVAALSHPAHDERLRAQRQLAARGAAAIAPLSEVVRRSKATPHAKVHAIWALFALANDGAEAKAVEPIVSALGDGAAEVRAQAARALGTLRARRAVTDLCHALEDRDASVRMWAAIALGRIGDRAAAPFLFAALEEDDVFARFAMIQAIRALNDWDEAFPRLREGTRRMREAVLLALTNVYDERAVAALRQGARRMADPDDRARAIAAMAEVARRAEPYTTGWWGTQPAAQPPKRKKLHDWPGTPTVMLAFVEGLSVSEPKVQLAVLEALERLTAPALLPKVRELAYFGSPLEVRIAAIRTLTSVRDTEAVPRLVEILADPMSDPSLRLELVRAMTAFRARESTRALERLARDPSTPSALTEACLDAFVALREGAGLTVVESLLDDTRAEIRAKAAGAWVKLKGKAAAPKLASLLADHRLEVRRAALKALGDSGAIEAVDAILPLVSVPETRYEALAALHRLPDRRALGAYLDGLLDKSQEIRDGARHALIVLRDTITPDIVALHERRELSDRLMAELQPVFSAPEPLRHWWIAGSWPKGKKPAFDPHRPPDRNATFQVDDRSFGWREVQTTDKDGKVDLRQTLSPKENVWGLAYTTLRVDQAESRQAFVGSDDELAVWNNGKLVYEFMQSRGWSPRQGKFVLELNPGDNHLWVLTGNGGAGWEFNLEVSRRDPKVAFLFEKRIQKLEPSDYAEFARSTPGDPVRGRKIFSDPKGVGCIKCHSVDGVGPKVGPDLTGIGAKYPRDELVRSILEPSNRILSGYQMSVIALTSGELRQGLIKAETDEFLEIVDAEAKTHRIPVGEIEAKQPSPLSLMPNGLKDGMTLEEFADLVAYLESLKASPSPAAQP